MDAAGGRGFTLPELLTSLAVMAILSTWAVSSYRNIVRSDTVLTQTNSLIFALSYARAEAIKQDAVVNVCAYDAASPPATPACGSNWAQGWLVYCNASTAQTTATAPICRPSGTNLVVLRTSDSLPSSGYTLNLYQGTTLAAAATSIEFSPTGTLFNDSGLATPNYSTYYFYVCDQRGASYAHDVEINPQGRVMASQTPGQRAHPPGLSNTQIAPYVIGSC